MPRPGRALRDQCPGRPFRAPRPGAEGIPQLPPGLRPVFDRIAEEQRMKLSVTKSGNACGADIKFDLSSELDDRTFAEIEQTFHDNIVVYFRGQQLSNERHIEFSRRWTGRKSLYVTAGECIGIEGLPDDEGVALIEELHAHCLRPEFQYRHKWQVGDLLMWDNATSMHLAICDYRLPERRLMHRTTVAGGVPV